MTKFTEKHRINLGISIRRGFKNGRIPYNKGKTTPSKIFMKSKKYCEVELYGKNGMITGFSKIDIDDIHKICKYRWHKRKSKDRGSEYAQTNIKGNTISIHVLIMGGKGIDHVNMDGLDNRKQNLRFADNTLQNINKKLQKNNKSGYRGVIFHPKTVNGTYYPYWESSITLKGKVIFLGCFKDKIKAVRARKIAEDKYFKDYENII